MGKSINVSQNLFVWLGRQGTENNVKAKRTLSHGRGNWEEKKVDLVKRKEVDREEREGGPLEEMAQVSQQKRGTKREKEHDSKKVTLATWAGPSPQWTEK